MKKLYASIQAELVDPELEAKINTDVQAEPKFEDIPSNLYAAITTNLPETSEIALTEEAQTFIPTLPHRLYKLLVPEKPAILAEERIFVYVPKASYDSAGIAKFKPTQFNIVDGEVSLKQNYLSTLISEKLINTEVIVVIEELPSTGLENKIYLVPVDSTTCTGYIWSELLKNWVSLGSMTLNLANYYTKPQTTTLLEEIISNFTEHLTNYYTKLQVNNKMDDLVLNLNNYLNEVVYNMIHISSTPPTDERIRLWIQLGEGD
jgi:hypothetical protein